MSISLTSRDWRVLSDIPFSPTSASVQRLASERHISLYESPKLSSPLLFPEMDRAIERIRRAFDDGEVIGIFGDYDADGITGTAQLVHMVKRHGGRVIPYLPDRLREGYGMKQESVDRLIDQGVGLIITVDTGVTAHKEIGAAKARGVDTIVTDHHRPQGGRPPAAYAVIHPELPHPFPNLHLSGSGVAFMLIRALENDIPWRGIDRDFTLAMIGTVGDLVPLLGENRTLVQHGLRYAATTNDPALRELIDGVIREKDIRSDDIAFRIVPRINAAGRMAHPNIALEALLDGGHALEELHRLNEERQLVVRQSVKDARDALKPDDHFICLFSPSFSAGTVGLIAGALTEETGKPSIVGAIDGDRITASLRSVNGIDLMTYLTSPTIAELLTSFGGHAYAAGCSLRKEHATELRERLLALIHEREATRTLKPTLLADAILDDGAITTSFVRDLQQLAPFGAGNQEPRFILQKQKISNVRQVGAEGLHLQCRIGGLKGIGFNLGHLSGALRDVMIVDALGTLSLSTWQGQEHIDLRIIDIAKTT